LTVPSTFGSQSMVAPLRRVVVKRPREAFGSRERIAGQWRDLGFTSEPDLGRADAEHDQLVALLRAADAEVLHLPEEEGTTLDSIYVHDPGLITEAGAIVFRTGKPQRRGEGPALARALLGWGVPVLGEVDGEATAEGGDTLWLDRDTLVVARGFRTNAGGVARQRELLAPIGVTVVEVHLPCGGGPADLLHLQSVISLLDHDLALVHRRLLPVPLFDLLLERGVELLDVPDEEYASLGCNVLALAPRRLAMLSALPRTRARLEAAGCDVRTFDGDEIGRKGGGGPTCLTRPVLRA
jgi:N-dimethylarginine dimethylaminohydrolase